MITSFANQGPYNVLLRSPLREERRLPLEAYLRSETLVPHRLSELATLKQAWAWQSREEVAGSSFCTEIATTHEASDLTFAKLMIFLAATQIVDLAAVSGTCVALPMLLAAGQELPRGSLLRVPGMAAIEPKMHTAVAR